MYDDQSNPLSGLIPGLGNASPLGCNTLGCAVWRTAVILFMMSVGAALVLLALLAYRRYGPAAARTADAPACDPPATSAQPVGGTLRRSARAHRE